MQEESATPFSQAELDVMLPVVLSDMKHHFEPADRVCNNANIRKSLYRHVIRELFSETRFLHKEKVGTQEDLFIKGYVRDVWAYLEGAYDLIHDIDYESQYAELIRTTI